MVTDKALNSVRDAAFGAIADPTRRAILDLVRAKEMSAGDIARRFPVSRPAIAKHVRVLRAAGLLRERRASTQRFYSLDPAALQAVDQWLAPYRLFWAARLMDLKRVVEADAQREPPQRRGKRKDPK
jgi:DNA-binding transcriptional ArsR family regulator